MKYSLAAVLIAAIPTGLPAQTAAQKVADPEQRDANCFEEHRPEDHGNAELVSGFKRW